MISRRSLINIPKWLLIITASLVAVLILNFSSSCTSKYNVLNDFNGQFSVNYPKGFKFTTVKDTNTEAEFTGFDVEGNSVTIDVYGSPVAYESIMNGLLQNPDTSNKEVASDEISKKNGMKMSVFSSQDGNNLSTVSVCDAGGGRTVIIVGKINNTSDKAAGNISSYCADMANSLKASPDWKGFSDTIIPVPSPTLVPLPTSTFTFTPSSTLTMPNTNQYSTLSNFDNQFSIDYPKGWTYNTSNSYLSDAPFNLPNNGLLANFTGQASGYNLVIEVSDSTTPTTYSEMMQSLMSNSFDASNLVSRDQTLTNGTVFSVFGAQSSSEQALFYVCGIGSDQTCIGIVATVNSVSSDATTMLAAYCEHMVDSLQIMTSTK